MEENEEEIALKCHEFSDISRKNKALQVYTIFPTNYKSANKFNCLTYFKMLNAFYMRHLK